MFQMKSLVWIPINLIGKFKRKKRKSLLLNSSPSQNNQFFQSLSLLRTTKEKQKRSKHFLFSKQPKKKERKPKQRQRNPARRAKKPSKQRQRNPTSKGKEIQQRMVGAKRKINFAQVHQLDSSSLLCSCVVAFIYIMNKEIESLRLEF